MPRVEIQAQGEGSHLQAFTRIKGVSMNLTNEDLDRIGHTAHENLPGEGPKNGTTFICDLKTSNIEAILLREILTPLGHEICSERDWHGCDDSPEPIGIAIVTTYPFDDYFCKE